LGGLSVIMSGFRSRSPANAAVSKQPINNSHAANKPFALREIGQPQIMFKDEHRPPNDSGKQTDIAPEQPNVRRLLPFCAAAVFFVSIGYIRFPAPSTAAANDGSV
jgi:hypothetical protein